MSKHKQYHHQTVKHVSTVPKQKPRTAYNIMMGFLVVCFLISLWEFGYGPDSMPGHSRYLMPVIFLIGILYLNYWRTRGHKKQGAHK